MKKSFIIIPILLVISVIYGCDSKSTTTSARLLTDTFTRKMAKQYTIVKIISFGQYNKKLLKEDHITGGIYYNYFSPIVVSTANDTFRACIPNASNNTGDMDYDFQRTVTQSNKWYLEKGRVDEITKLPLITEQF